MTTSGETTGEKLHPEDRRFIIVGAGPVGLLAAILLVQEIDALQVRHTRPKSDITAHSCLEDRGGVSLLRSSLTRRNESCIDMARPPSLLAPSFKPFLTHTHNPTITLPAKIGDYL